MDTAVVVSEPTAAAEPEVVYTDEHKPYLSDPPSQPTYEVQVGDLKILELGAAMSKLKQEDEEITVKLFVNDLEVNYKEHCLFDAYSCPIWLDIERNELFMEATETFFTMNPFLISTE